MSAGAYGLASGELLAVRIPPGPAWIEVVHRCWSGGIPLLPLDVRLPERDLKDQVERARPAGLLDETGEVTIFAAPARIDERIAVVVATSGTGGRPKLVELSRDAVESAVSGSAAALGISGKEHWVCCLTPAHIGGLLVLLRSEVLGGSVEVHESFDAGRVVSSGRGAIVSVVPTMVSRMVDASQDLALTSLVVGGGALERALRESAVARGARVVSTYGMTETCGGVVYDGVPFEGMQVRLGADEQIELRGPTLMEGYRGDPAATGSAFDIQGWLRTGDLGAFDNEGRLVVHGRADRVIRTGGEKVWPEEVERILIDHPKVRDVEVFGAPHPEWGQQVAARVVPVDERNPPDLEKLRSWTKERMAAFKVPRSLELVSHITRASTTTTTKELR